MGKDKKSAAGDARLRRLAFGAYARPWSAARWGGEMLAEAPAMCWKPWGCTGA